MISKFFIEHPVLANVLAIVLVLIGAICVFRLPVAQYPNVTPPTVQVTTRYPGASPQTIVDTVALPIELQVNGVEGMLYMESTSAYDGTYTLTVTFQIGTDPNMDQVLVQNRVTNALAQLPAGGAVAGGGDPREILVDPRIRDPQFAGRLARRALYVELRDDQSGERAGAAAGGRQRHGDGCRRILDADLDGPAEALFLWPGSGRRDPRHSPAEPGGRGRAGRHAARAQGPAVPVHRRHPVAARRSEPVRRHRRQGPDQPRRQADQAQGRGPHRAGRADLRPGFQARRQAGRRHRHISDPGREFPEGRGRSRGQDGRAGAPLPARSPLQHPLQYHDLRQGLDRRGLQDLVAGRGAGADRDPGILAELSRDLGAGDDGPGHDHRRVRRHGGTRLHRQFVDAVRADPGDRHCRRRRDRHRRGRVQIHRAGHVGARRRDPGDGRTVRPGRRHHARPDGGVPAVGLCPRPQRADLRAVRARYRGDGADQRGQRRDPEADAMRAVAAHAEAGGAAQFFLSRLQPCL